MSLVTASIDKPKISHYLVDGSIMDIKSQPVLEQERHESLFILKLLIGYCAGNWPIIKAFQHLIRQWISIDQEDLALGTSRLMLH